MKPIIRVENLSKQYRIGARKAQYATLRDKLADAALAPLKAFRNNEREETIWALRNVSFEIAPGEVVGIIGHNGAGKSTLLKILSRITEPTQGEVALFGRIASLLEVGTGFHGELTGRENIFLNGAILGMHRSEIKRKFDEIIAFSEVEEFLDLAVKHYSTGMYMRLAFSVAAHLEPEVLIVDEVLAVGDLAFQSKCLNKMDEVSSTGRTVILVSHNLDAIQRIATRAIVLDSGTQAFSGAARDAIRFYLQQKKGGTDRNCGRYSQAGMTCSWRINGLAGGQAAIWESGSPLELEVELSSDALSSCPSVDVAFFCMDGRKVFGVMSDRLVDHTTVYRGHHWRFQFLINDANLVRQTLYFDLGVRDAQNPHYRFIWSRAGEVEVTSNSQSASLAVDSVLAPEIRISLERPVVNRQAARD